MSVIKSLTVTVWRDPEYRDDRPTVYFGFVDEPNPFGAVHFLENIPDDPVKVEEWVKSPHAYWGNMTDWGNHPEPGWVVIKKFTLENVFVADGLGEEVEWAP